MKRRFLFLSLFLLCLWHSAAALCISQVQPCSRLRNDTLSAVQQEYCRSRNAEAMTYYNEGYYNLAFDCFLELQDFGYPPAITNLGIAYMNGAGTKQNLEKAYRCFVRAADKGEPVAQLHLGTMYSFGLYVEQSDSAALYWYGCSSRQGYTKAMNAFANVYLGKADTLEARKWLRLSALAGDTDGLHAYGVLLSMSDPGYVDDELGTARNCIYRAAKTGHKESQMLLLEDALQSGSKRHIFYWAEILHNAGECYATRVLADCYRYGYGTARSKSKAKELYRQAADRGDDEALRILEEW